MVGLIRESGGMWVPSFGGKEKWDMSCLATGIKGGKFKEDFEEERDVTDIEAFLECERVWECLGPG